VNAGGAGGPVDREALWAPPRTAARIPPPWPSAPFPRPIALPPPPFLIPSPALAPAPPSGLGRYRSPEATAFAVLLLGNCSILGSW